MKNGTTSNWLGNGVETMTELKMNYKVFVKKGDEKVNTKFEVP